MGRKRRIVVHTMQEAEGSLVQSILGRGAQRHANRVEGLADEAQVETLRQRNLIVELAEEAAVAARREPGLFRASARLDWRSLEEKGMPTAPSGEPVAVPSRRRTATFALRSADPAIALPDLLEPVGAQVDRILVGGFAVARLRPRQRALLEADPRVELAPFNISPVRMPTRELTIEEREALAPSTGEEREFDLVAHSPDRVAEIESWARSKGAALALLGSAGDRVRIRVRDTSPLLDEADELDAVLDIQPVPATFLCLDRARRLIGLAEAPGQVPISGPLGPLDGAGETVAMIDGTVDVGHPDLAGRVRMLPESAAAATAHGTHVAGIIAGNGRCSDGRFRGIAPAATLVACGLAVGSDGRIDLDVDFRAMLERLYQAGARVLNLSFDEDSRPSYYSQRANDLDAFAAARPDMLIVVAAGNRAMTEKPLDRPAGEVGLESVSAPGVAKNVLTVGASCSDRTDGGHRAADWNAYAPARFVTAPTSRAPVSGDPSLLAAFSGRGWCQDNRIKPELVAPGTNIVAARARGLDDALWGEYSADYAYSGGTSMAAPIVAGAAALVRQYYRQRDHAAPSSALLRATLANGADWLTGANATYPLPEVLPGVCANLDQGFGRVDVPNALGLKRPNDRICYVDVGADGTGSHTVVNGTVSPFASNSSRRGFFFHCEPEGEVDIALCYLDPEPGSGGVALLLQVQATGGERRIGNDRAIKRNYPAFGPAPDRSNRVQIVRLGPTSGKVDIQISPLVLMDHSVGFALVVRGPVRDGRLFAY